MNVDTKNACREVVLGTSCVCCFGRWPPDSADCALISGLLMMQEVICGVRPIQLCADHFEVYRALSVTTRASRPLS